MLKFEFKINLKLNIKDVLFCFTVKFSAVILHEQRIVTRHLERCWKIYYS